MSYIYSNYKCEWICLQMRENTQSFLFPVFNPCVCSAYTASCHPDMHTHTHPPLPKPAHTRTSCALVLA